MLLSHVSFLTSLKSYSIIYQILSFKNLIMNLYNPILVSITTNPVFSSAVWLKAVIPATATPATAAFADTLALRTGATGVFDTVLLNHAVALPAAAPGNGIFAGSNIGGVSTGGLAGLGTCY